MCANISRYVNFVLVKFFFQYLLPVNLENKDFRFKYNNIQARQMAADVCYQKILM